MIVYDPLWRTMKKKGFTTYTLIVKNRVSGSTVNRLKHNRPVSTNTLDDLCKLLDCTLPEIVEFVPDPAPEPEQTTPPD